MQPIAKPVPAEREFLRNSLLFCLFIATFLLLSIFISTEDFVKSFSIFGRDAFAGRVAGRDYKLNSFQLWDRKEFLCLFLVEPAKYAGPNAFFGGLEAEMFGGYGDIHKLEVFLFDDAAEPG